MRIVFKRAPSASEGPEALALVILLGGFLAGGVWLLLGLPTPHCVLRLVTGIPCFTCGGTRCVRALAEGEWGTALAWNPGVVVAILVAGAFVIYAALALALRVRIRVRGIGRRGWWVIRAALVAALLGNWAYLISRFW